MDKKKQQTKIKPEAKYRGLPYFETFEVTGDSMRNVLLAVAELSQDASVVQVFGQFNPQDGSAFEAYVTLENA